MDSKTIEIIKSTVPVLEQHGEKITTVFYQQMFEAHPELLNIFNHANQKQGRQQKALASTVYAAAQYIDNLEAIVPVVTQIAHKHRSLGIKPEHYPIVGEHLLGAIKTVLGQAATDEILDAWEQAYNTIADVFISVEAQMYQDAKNQHGGWDGFKSFVVDRKVVESEVITSFYLKPEDKQMLPSFEAGQYISVKLEIEEEKFTHIRQYSLSDAAGKDYYRISVKRETGNETPDGIVSNYLHEKMNEGDTIQVSAPAGDFYLDTGKDTPLVLLSGGVGLTPMMSMLNTVVDLQPERPVTFIHATGNGRVHALRDEVKRVAEKGNVNVVFFYDSPTEEDRETQAFDIEGFVTKEWLRENVPHNDTSFYFCGPVPFMKSVNASLKSLGVTDKNIHFEFFGPMGSLE
ncbi:nitric oxide dioxygenase [Oceanobacillus limi]|uniref:Flavohemoprotein n=2 Tax=Oceanobacillus limi TaxID=930131 RepID=A0A1I0FYQ1_9BACI|nr:nitric oxide dioxygenase [Oceanobacillus limi]